MIKKSFMVYTDNCKQVNMLSDEQAGILFKSMLSYAQTGEEPEFDDDIVRIVFSFISAQMDRDNLKYEETCRKRAEAGKKGGAPKGNKNASKTSNCFSKQPKQPDTDKDTDTDTDKDTDKDKDTDTDKDTEKETKRDTDINIIPPSPSVLEILDLFNEICISYPKAKNISDSRENAVKSILSAYGKEKIREVFEKTEKSSFLKGFNQRNWTASFDWIMNSANFVKILDGNYDDKPQPPPQNDDYDESIWGQII